MSKWRIKTKRDWGIAFVFATLIIYAITKRLSNDEFMMRFSPDKLDFFNQPVGYGNWIVTILAMTMLSVVVLLVKKKNIKIWCSVIVLGILLESLTLGAYLVRCNRILKMPETEQAASAYISDFNSKPINLQAGDERLQKLVELAYSLEELPDAEQTVLRNQMKRDSRNYVEINFPRKHGDLYCLSLRIEQDTIYLQRGRGYKEVYYYKDNGLIDFVNALK